MIEEEIPAALAGERLDRLVSLITDCSRSDAAVLVAAGGASVDGEVQLIGKVRVKGIELEARAELFDGLDDADLREYGLNWPVPLDY